MNWILEKLFVLFIFALLGFVFAGASESNKRNNDRDDEVGMDQFFQMIHVNPDKLFGGK